MATGVGMGFDLDALDKAIKSADKGIENLIKNGQRMEQALTQNFRNVAEQGIGALVSKMDSVNGLLANLGKQKSGKLQIETSTAKAVENAVRFSELMGKINNEGASSRTNSAVYKINEELEAAKRRLAELSKLLNFYAKGEGKSAIGFVDTSSTQQEARALMNRIDLLEREKASLQANARLRMEISQMRDNRQNTIDANYAEMAKRAAKESSEAAKAESRIYEERDAKREQAQREYDAMGRKMRQQTNLDLAREYELQEAQNKRNEGSLKQQMEAQRKFAEERVKLEETLAAKTKNDEHKRLQKEWQDQLKARDEAEKAYIKAEEQRQKEKNKQDANNAAATVKNLDKMHEQQHRKELQRINEDAMRQQEKEKAEAELNKKRLAWVKQVDDEEKRKHQNELDRINKRFDVLRRREENQRREEQAKLNTTQGSLASYNQLYSPQGVRSLNQMKTVLKQLETAQANINRATKEGQRDWNQVGDAIKRVKRDIESAEKEMGKFHNQKRGILDTSGQLARAMAAVFSVSAIKGYVNKLMQIRGEFELQQRSLQVLLQNKDEANALWDKTVALAVKSPYTTKQLVTATKQLAAYRIESEKLYETNKMLADVSIGLGVDINRLILAFGQVKAANFLRGTELRQFSEAGVNMLDELAKHFTALEGRAVSVGEVFERVSKRMVSFADVEAVFKTITSEGGTFYQMQEKQSETLKGMMLNLKDSYELMLNDIGKDSEDRLKGFVSLMRTIVDNWRALEPYIKTAGLTFIAYFGASQIAKLFSWFGKLTTAVRAFGTASAGATAINPWVALATVIGAVVAAIYSASTATDEFTASMQEVDKEVSKSLGESVALYRQLTNTINDSTASLEEQNKAYSNLKSKFGEILPDHLLELDYIKGKGSAYQEAEMAMRAYYDSQSKEFKKSKIMQSTDIYTVDIPEFATQFNQEIEDLEISEEKKLALQQQSAQIITSVVDDILNGAIKVEDGLKEIGLRASKFIGEDIDVSKFGEGTFNMYRHQLVDLYLELNDILKKLKVITGLPFETLDESKATDAKNRMQEEVEIAEEYFTKLANIYTKVASGDYSRDVSYVEVDKIWSEILGIDGMEKYIPILENALKSLTNTAQKGLFEYQSVLSVIKSGLYTGDGGFADIALGMTEGASEAATYLFTNLSKELTKKGEDILRTPMQETIVNAINYVSDSHNLDDATKNLFAKFIPTGKDQTTTTIRQSIKSTMEQFEELKKLYEISKAAGGESLPFVDWLGEQTRGMDALFLSTVKVLAINEKAMPALQQLYGILGGEIKQTGGGNRDIFAERLRVIKEIYQAYKDLGKTLDEAGAKEGAMAKFGNAFKEAFGKTPEEMGFDLFSEEGVKKAYDYLIKNAPNAKKKIQAELAKGEIVLETKVRLQQEEDKKFADQIADMFSGYELSLELQKLNIPPDLANQLFGVKTFDLSQIRERLEKEIADAEKVGGREDFVKERKKELEKVKEMERKAQEDRLKRYSQFLIKGYNERINLKLQELRELELLEQDKEKLTPQQYEAAKKGIQEEYRTKALQQQWKDFEQSSQYINLFDDIENASTASLQSMKSNLEQLKQSMIASGLPAKDLKEILAQIEKVEEEIEQRTPFKSFGEDIKTVLSGLKEQIELRKEEKRLIDDIKRLENEKPTDEQVAEEQNNAKNNPQYQQLLSAQKLLGTLKEGTHEYEIQKALVAKLEKDVYPLTTAHNEITEELKEQEKQLGEVTEKTKKWEKAFKGIGSSFVKFGDKLSDIGSFVDDIAGKWETAFGISDTAMADLQTFAGIAQGAGQAISSIGQGFMTGDWLSAGMGAVSGIMSIASTLGQAHDKKKERQIQREIKLVEHLGKLYEKLEKQINAAYSIDTFKMANDAAKENIEEQIRATERMIEAEKDKKKTDKKRIEEWRKQIEGNLEILKELEVERLQQLGGIGGEDYYKDIAQGWIDAWLDGFLEVGDGLANLEDEFDTVLMNIAKKQLMLRATDKFLSPLYKAIDDAVADTDVTRQEMSEIESKAKEALPQLNEFLKQLMEEMGMSDLAGSKGELGSLSAGISGITETQADIISAYLNSLRFYVADSNTQLKALVAAQGIDTDTPNPMLSQLLVIAEQTRAIRDMFDSVIGRGGNNKHAGAYLKVDIG